MERDILYLAVPAFAIAVARVIDPALRQRPVVVTASPQGRSLIQQVSAEAEAEGVAPGMPLHRAWRRCPGLLPMAPDPLLVHRADQALQRLCRPLTPLWEPKRPGQLYLDLSGTIRLQGPGRDQASRLEREVTQRLSLPVHLGVAGNKLVSHLAARYLPTPGLLDILRGSEATFVGPLSLQQLPDLTPDDRTRLRELNLNRVQQLRDLPSPFLGQLFGRRAARIREHCAGIDWTPVLPPGQAPAIVEQVLLQQADNHHTALAGQLRRLAETCGRQLRRQGCITACLYLRLTYTDTVCRQRQLRLSPGIDQDDTLAASAQTLLEHCHQRRIRVRQLRLSCHDLQPAGEQLSLFSSPHNRPEGLQSALDRLRDRHGTDCVQWAR